MASRKKCPPGVLCLSSQLVFFMLVVALGCILLLVMFRDQRVRPVVRPMAMPAQPQPVHIRIDRVGGDDRYSMAPQPYRSWLAEAEYPPRGGLAHIPIGIPTRGLPERFQSMGIITTPDGQALPLYGRRTGGSNDRWNYYTRTDTYNPVPVPLTYQKRDCMDDVGCSEIMDGDDVKSALGKDGKVTIYKMDGPKYIPGLI
jgi:hypothetical protein